MHLYHLSVQSPGSVCQAVAGNFSERRVNEIVQVRGSVIELLQIDPDTGRSKSLCARNTFSTIRSIAPFRLTGGELDYVIVGSDSGKISVLKFNPETRDFEQVHNEMFGKTGCRRTVPGQYLATDPSGRAVMIAAVERAKFVYVLNRDSKTNLIISSPLEAHKSKTLVFSCVGLDVGFENPLFACLEVDYEDFDSYADVENAKMTKHLTIYELDLGLNHVTRKSSEEVDSTASMLIPIPSGTSGPGGVLICGEGKLTYRNLEKDVNVEVLIPKRKNETTQALVAASCMLKQKNTFFILIQTELGDLWKLTVNSDGSSMKIVYFDSIPVCSSLCMLKAGYLYCATELGNHFVMQFLNLDGNSFINCTFSYNNISTHYALC